MASLNRNAKHNWTDDWQAGEESTCKDCGETFDPLFVGHQPPTWGCGQPKKSRINPVSEGRSKRRIDDEGRKVVYGPIFEAVSKLPCMICSNPEGPAHHVTTVGAGGKDKENLVPLCPKHHNEVHTIGTQSFEDKYNVDLEKEAKQYYERAKDGVR